MNEQETPEEGKRTKSERIADELCQMKVHEMLGFAYVLAGREPFGKDAMELIGRGFDKARE